ncbi:hypothetical protein D1872_283010 [compost metagenome]
MHQLFQTLVFRHDGIDRLNNPVDFVLDRSLGTVPETVPDFAKRLGKIQRDDVGKNDHQAQNHDAHDNKADTSRRQCLADFLLIQKRDIGPTIIG